MTGACIALALLYVVDAGTGAAAERRETTGLNCFIAGMFFLAGWAIEQIARAGLKAAGLLS